MGGGTALRAAAKYGGIGVLSSGFRTETPVNLSVQKVVKHVSSGLVSLSSIGSDSTTGNVSVDQAVQKPSWKSAGNEDEFVIDKSRLVFGTFPTIEETKEATSELTDALDQVYLSSPKSSGIVHETKYCVPQESSVPKTAMQAFRLLKESPAAQNVVASIACDPNVWDAVMQNPDLVNFLYSEKQSSKSESPRYHGLEFLKTPICASDDNSSVEPDALTVLFENVKVGLTDMVHYLSNLVQSWFSIPNEEQRSKYVDGKSTKNYIAGGSFMALAVMVIMVVVLKR